MASIYLDALPQKRPPFGHKGSITAAAIAAMPFGPQKAEGLLLMAEMGMSRIEIGVVTGLALIEIDALCGAGYAPFQTRREEDE